MPAARRSRLSIKIRIAPDKTARMAGLRYATDAAPGVRRKTQGKSFVYFDQRNRRIASTAVLARISALRIPPAWSDVWICPPPRGHLQATGRDSRGRKQYRYHDRWQATRGALKYERMIAFAKALPRIRRRIGRAMSLPGLSREKVLAAMIRLMDRTYIRVGNEEYTKANNSYGLTTLQDRHVAVLGPHMLFRFRAKSGKTRQIELFDKGLAKIVRKCQELPGQDLFQYVDDDGSVRDVTSRDINDYLRETSGQDFTAKDFRTWAGTTLAVECLGDLPTFTSKSAAARNVVRAIDSVAQSLGNTRAVCRKSYIHPGVIDAYLDQAFENGGKTHRRIAGLSTLEVRVLALLERLARAASD